MGDISLLFGLNTILIFTCKPWILKTLILLKCSLITLLHIVE